MKFEKLVIEKLAAGIINLNSITFPENIMSIATKGETYNECLDKLITFTE